ncbi:MAG: DUF3789 domain-containing protein [Clostridia bacterium]|nr:DUF3789 domain-containing protein [Clostridia bacterium]
MWSKMDFLLGVLIGAIIGVFCMCILQVTRE